jgi:uncharacterized membrane protein
VGDNTLSTQLEREGVAIYATRQGYIQDIDTDLALTLATRHDLVIRLVCKPGIFVEDGQLIAIVAPAARVSSRVAANIAGSYRLGNARTPTQDVEYAVNQLVEVAVRAMSPAINDPFTAMTCLDHLGARLAVLAARPPTKAYLYDSNGRPRLLLDSISFAELLDTAFHMLRRAARDNTEVLFSLLQAIEVIGRPLCSDDYRAELLRHIQLVEAESQASSSVAWDKERVGRRCAALAQNLNGVEGNTNVARG